ncbi:MAG: hypothetical protein ACRD4Q_16205 [Candidatus Acidiferrales bacterium]
MNQSSAPLRHLCIDQQGRSCPDHVITRNVVQRYGFALFEEGGSRV